MNKLKEYEHDWRRMPMSKHTQRDATGASWTQYLWGCKKCGWKIPSKHKPAADRLFKVEEPEVRYLSCDQRVVEHVHES